MAYGAYKRLPRKTASKKSLRDKAFAIAGNPKHDVYQVKISFFLSDWVLNKLLTRETRKKVYPHFSHEVVTLFSLYFTP